MMLLHLWAGFKDMSRAENTAAGAGRGVGGVKQESSRNQCKGTPKIGKYSLGMKSWNFSLFSREDTTCAILWALTSMSPLKSRSSLLLSFTSLKWLHLPHFSKLLLLSLLHDLVALTSFSLEVATDSSLLELSSVYNYRVNISVCLLVQAKNLDLHASRSEMFPKHTGNWRCGCG